MYKVLIYSSGFNSFQQRRVYGSSYTQCKVIFFSILEYRNYKYNLAYTVYLLYVYANIAK